MSREIKFRAWDKKRNEWVHKIPCDILGETILLCEWMKRPDGSNVRLEELNGIEIMQYTGLNDKNGTPIYEGDIVDYFDGKSGYTDFIEWEQGCFFLRGYTTHDLSSMNLNVIGNIYEHPELLNATTPA